MTPPGLRGPGCAERSPGAPQALPVYHIAVTVSSLDRAIGLYQERLGFLVIAQLVRPDEPPGFTIAYFEGKRES